MTRRRRRHAQARPASRAPLSVMAFVRDANVTGISAINHYRAQGPLSALGAHDTNAAVEVLGKNDVVAAMQTGKDDQLLGRQVYVVSRLFAGKVGRGSFLEAIHKHGGIVVFDTDDDLTDNHRELGRGEDFKGILKTVDFVTVSTPHLKKQLASYTPHPPVVLPNHVKVNWFAQTCMQAERKVSGLTIGFIGTASHFGDWRYPMEALRRIAMEHPEITIVAAGYCPDYLKELPNLMELGPVPYYKYPELMAQFDIVCCSLDAEDEFNKSKSAIKALEAMSAARVLSNNIIGGAVPVCTDMPVYRRVVNHRHNGLLTANNRWYRALTTLIEDPALWCKLSVRGYKWVRAHRNVDHGCHLWGRAYRKMLEAR